jgi:MinD superfamily P-loop ATPase
MQIAVLSGKGGTGKTFISVNLACVTENAVYVDCDVEEPNGHLFLKPEITGKQSVFVSVPEWDKTKCTFCRKCVDFCRYNALALIKEKLYVFNEVCHSCGGCMILCPQKAITEKPREIGVVETGKSDDVTILTGCLNTGEVSGVPVIKALLKKLDDSKNTIIDCPPGSACVVMESIKKADYCILVAEPTLFGVHNFQMVYELVKSFKKPFGAVLNKCIDSENPAKKFCEENNIPVLAELKYDEKLAKLNSDGLIAVRECEEYAKKFRQLLSAVKEAIL